ncbi:MAG: putative enoyl-CoA hydratase [Pseudonocardiales bacterium]|nr:putative enoyl-CoA hydratase [Pseudonocardiales bacterium]
MTERVSTTITDGVADVRMTRPDKRNALDNEMFQALADAGEELKSAKGLRAVVLSGEGASFCAGLDFGSFRTMAEGAAADPEAAAERRRRGPSAIAEGQITHRGQQACWVWQELPVPVIAAVHGHALGGGIQIALGADIRIVHPATQLSVRETYWGLVPDMTGTLTLSQLVRADVLKDLVFTARVFSGTEAYEIGIATRLSETPYEDAMTMARELAAMNPDALRGAKALINGLLHDKAASQFAEERRIISSLGGTPNQAETVAANFAKRPAVYVD